MEFIDHPPDDSSGDLPQVGHSVRVTREYQIAGVIVRGEGRWTSAGTTPARELVRSPRKQSKRQRRQRSCRSLRCKGSHGDSASVQAIT